MEPHTILIPFADFHIYSPIQDIIVTTPRRDGRLSFNLRSEAAKYLSLTEIFQGGGGGGGGEGDRENGDAEQQVEKKVEDDE